GWANYLAVAPEQRRQGLGRAIMARAEELLAAVGCPKVNLQVRGDNTAVIDFYRTLGYEVEDRASLGKRLEHDEPS
ncbi:MAG: GNAT family N-acetyltransferase, partial [Myxococcota bacterium]